MQACVHRVEPFVPVCASDVQASAMLFQFDQLGPEFVELASMYRDLQEDLDHANFTLHEFQKAAADEPLC